MNTASRTPPMNTAMTTPLRHTALSAMINPKLLTQAEPTSLLHQSIKAIIRQMHMLLSRKAPTTHTQHTTLQTTRLKARTHPMNRLEARMATAVLH